jgi:hypothetical protein
MVTLALYLFLFQVSRSKELGKWTRWMNDARRPVFVAREEVRKEPEGSIICVIIHCSLELVEPLCMYKDDLPPA